jgi:hypothetical protein
LTIVCGGLVVNYSISTELLVFWCELDFEIPGHPFEWHQGQNLLMYGTSATGIEIHKEGRYFE